MTIEEQVKKRISSEGGRMDQRRLVQSMDDASEGEVLHAVRGLMQRGDISYTLDWQLMIEDQ